MKLPRLAKHPKGSLAGLLSESMLLTSVVYDVQKQIDSLAASYRDQQNDFSSDSSDEQINSELSSYRSSQSSHVGSDSVSD